MDHKLSKIGYFNQLGKSKAIIFKLTCEINLFKCSKPKGNWEFNSKQNVPILNNAPDNTETFPQICLYLTRDLQFIHRKESEEHR